MNVLPILIAHATEDELRVINTVLARANSKPAVIVKARDGRRYVVAQEDEALFQDLIGLDESELRARVGHTLASFGAQWLRGYGRVDEMYRSLSLSEVVKVTAVDRDRVWGR